MVWQLLKTDEASRKLIGSPMPPEFIPINSAVHSPLLFKIDTIEFTHAYMLLGSSPSRFGYDLSLYLSIELTSKISQIFIVRWLIYASPVWMSRSLISLITTKLEDIGEHISFCRATLPKVGRLATKMTTTRADVGT